MTERDEDERDPAPGPFSPRVREPWINPAKRGAAAAIAAVAAVLLVGVGVLIGLAVHSGHGHHGPRDMRFDHGWNHLFPNGYGPLAPSLGGTVPTPGATPGTTPIPGTVPAPRSGSSHS